MAYVSYDGEVHKIEEVAVDETFSILPYIESKIDFGSVRKVNIFETENSD